MINSRQRSYLRGLANKINPSLHMGKNGLTESVIRQLDIILEANELVKVKLLDASLLDAKETANMVAERLEAEYVQSIGNRFVLYRATKDKKREDRIKLPRA